VQLLKQSVSSNLEGLVAMKQLSDLRLLFRVVVALEAVYALVAVLTPPGQVETVTGWVLTADGQWLAKLLGLALASQALVAWVLRDEPHLGVAKALAFYQLASATADWVMWIWLADQGIFSNGGAVVVGAIATHYALGLLLVRAIRRTSLVSGSPQLSPLSDADQSVSRAPQSS
jgi:hypothetical protein